MRIKEMVGEAINILESKDPISDFGHLLHESWLHKRSLSSRVSSTAVDEIYDIAKSNGALGGKLLGAGGGGFMLLFVPPEHQPTIIEKLKHLVHVPFEFENTGSRIVLYQPDGF